MEKLISLMKDQGWEGQVVPYEHITDLRQAISVRLENGLIDKRFYEGQLGFFSFDPPSELPEIRSIIIVAVPTPQMRIIFRWKGKSIPVIVPPTYVSYSSRTAKTQEILTGWLEREGYSLGKPSLPLKTLAAWSGLAKYGRNNISYVEGMGSFLQLVGAFTDMPCDNDPWQNPGMLDRCESCFACQKNCPTKAISKNRFLLHAEKCLTYHNESMEDFQSWIDPSWHHCLVGCMRCQEICPENKAVVKWIEDRGEFSEKETALFIQGVPADKMPEEMSVKFKRLEINENYKVVCRNLAMIIGRE